MRLKSFGCSFIYGSDLHDDGRYDLKASASKYTWPALVARHHGWDYTCYARPGSGNLQILERLLNQLADAEPAVYIIGWTWIDRFDYTTTEQLQWRPIIPVENVAIDEMRDKLTALQWRTIMPVDTDAKAATYYRDLHSEYRDKLTSLIHVRTAIDALKESGNQFIMTYMDDLMFDQRWNTSPAVSELQRRCRPYMTQFEGKNLLEYSKDHGFEISATQHPLEAAHQSAAELILSYNLV